MYKKMLTISTRHIRKETMDALDTAAFSDLFGEKFKWTKYLDVEKSNVECWHVSVPKTPESAEKVLKKIPYDLAACLRFAIQKDVDVLCLAWDAKTVEDLEVFDHESGALKYILTENGRRNAMAFIRELEAKRKEILDAGKDTADDTDIPTVEDIMYDISFVGITKDDPDGPCYCNGWGATDNYDSDSPMYLKLGRDFVPVAEA